jgi:hypothetical protein
MAGVVRSHVAVVQRAEEELVMASLIKSPRTWVVAVAVIVIVGPVILVYRLLNPSDRVVVSLVNFDPSTRLFCLLADTSDGPRAMWWSHDKVVPFEMHPNEDIHSRVFDGEGRQAVRKVSWRLGSRYGVLIRDRSDRWLLLWFSPKKVHLRWFWLIGGGKAFIDLQDKDRAEPASEQLLDAVGFGPEVRKFWRDAL